MNKIFLLPLLSSVAWAHPHHHPCRLYPVPTTVLVHPIAPVVVHPVVVRPAGRLRFIGQQQQPPAAVPPPIPATEPTPAPLPEPPTRVERAEK